MSKHSEIYSLTYIQSEYPYSVFEHLYRESKQKPRDYQPCYCLLIFTFFEKKTLECKIDWIQIRPNFCGPDLGPNYLQKLSADDKSHRKQGKDLKVTPVDKQLN